MTKVEKAIKTLKKAFMDDPDYAHSWHCNLAMAYFDASNSDVLEADDSDAYTKRVEIANDGASRFMKLAFDVKTSA